MKYSRSDLNKLSSNRGLTYLLRTNPPDFDGALNKLKYRKKLRGLQKEMNKVQNWVVANDKRVVVIFEGLEFAGKGSAIRAFTRRLNPRSARIVALPKPTKMEEGQWYFKRYIGQLPKPGEMVFFDRSWYNRAIVEPVNGFCTKKEYDRFMSEVNHFERMIHNDGIIMIKLFLSIHKEVQKERIEIVRNNPLRSWELTAVDKKAQRLWKKYKVYEKAMFDLTDTAQVPWKVIDSNVQEKANLNALKYVLATIPYLD